MTPGSGKLRGSENLDILVIGELNVDLLLYGDVTPAFDQAEKLVSDATLTVGSSSAIFACQAAKLGLRVGFVGRVGRDYFGEYMLESLKEVGVDTSGVITDPVLKTGLTLHLVRSEDRAMLTFPGTISALRSEDVDKDLLKRSRHLHVGSYFLQTGLQGGLTELLETARKSGTSVSLDPGWDPEESWGSGLCETLAATDIFLPNEQELLAVTGSESLEEALDNLAGVSTVVVKRGAAGALAHEDGVAKECSSPQLEVVDTTGAGDSFDAGFLFGKLRGGDVGVALAVGCICGALSTQGSGGVEAQPDLNQVEKLLPKILKKERFA